MFYMYWYNLLFISNPAWTNFMYDGLGFSDLEVGILNTLGAVMGWLGIWAYDNFFFNDRWPWL